ncbi:MAG: LLM class flavin-dependent oxidoreductase [Pseudomonadales bacterium]|nr:LLM class flavin-dependent oxidoreductase [Pseudomonadales bacterium]
MAIGIGLGIARFPFEEVDSFWEWVQVCEQGGIDSLWQTDRLVSKEPFLECMSTMAAIAGATQRIKFGMNVASVGLRDPLLLAKQCATIDFLSKGRLLPAFGIGAAQSREWQAIGQETKGRGRRADEALDIVVGLWRGDSVSLDGTYYQYTNVRISPIPFQQSLPLWIGGSSPAAIARTARVGTGWQAGFESPKKAGKVKRAIIDALKETGRSIDDDHYGTGFFFRFGNEDDPSYQSEMTRMTKFAPDRDMSHTIALGSSQIIERIKQFSDEGISKFILRPLGENDEDLLLQTQRLIDEILPLF